MTKLNTTNQMIAEFARVLAPIPMDRAVLSYLVEVGGSQHTASIPARLFRGEIPAGHPNMVDLGLVEHRGEITLITEAGRAALTA